MYNNNSKNDRAGGNGSRLRLHMKWCHYLKKDSAYLKIIVLNPKATTKITKMFITSKSVIERKWDAKMGGAGKEEKGTDKTNSKMVL